MGPKFKQKKERSTDVENYWSCSVVFHFNSHNNLAHFTDEETKGKAVQGNALHCLANQVQLQDLKLWLRVSVAKGETAGSLQPDCLVSVVGSDPYWPGDTEQVS